MRVQAADGNRRLGDSQGDQSYAIRRFSDEVNRLYGVMNNRLYDRRYLAGDEYTIADMAIWPWISRFERHQVDIRAYPNVTDWYVRIAERPAVQRGYNVPLFTTDIPMP